MMMAELLSAYRSIWFTHKLEFRRVLNAYFPIYANNVLNFNEAYALMNLIYIKHITRAKKGLVSTTHVLIHCTLTLSRVWVLWSIVGAMVLHSLDTRLESNRLMAWQLHYMHIPMAIVLPHSHSSALSLSRSLARFVLCATDTGVFASN